MSMDKSTRDSDDAPIITDPYSVPVGKTATNNPPFIFKRSKKLPAGWRKSFESHNTRERKENSEDSHVDTTGYVPELYQSHCQKNRIIECSARLKS